MSISAIIYDLEVIKAVPVKNEPRTEGIDYCQGWSDHQNMGIALICTYDYIEDRYRVFCADNLSDFVLLLRERTFRVGFNNINFDDRVLRANDVELSEYINEPYDILRELWRAAGVDPDAKYKVETHGGFSLDACATANFGEQKSGDGAHAPVLWQLGKVGSVVDYCLQDVRLTKKLFDLILAGVGVVDPRSPVDPQVKLFPLLPAQTAWF